MPDDVLGGKSASVRGAPRYSPGVLAVLLVGLSVGLDNFAAAIGIGLRGLDVRLRVRVALVFGLFEGGMPIVGLVIGHSLARRLGADAHVIGGSVLGATGVYGLVGSWVERRHEQREPPRGLRQLLLVGAALSIDNLIVGFALGSYRVSIVLAALLIAAVSVALSMVGLEFGSRLGERIGEASEFLGGSVLVAVGAAIAFGVI